MKENYASRRAAEAVADARDMSAADFATPQDRRTRRCAWGGESEGWKGEGRGEGGAGHARSLQRHGLNSAHTCKNSLKSIEPEPSRSAMRNIPFSCSTLYRLPVCSASRARTDLNSSKSCRGGWGGGSP